MNGPGMWVTPCRKASNASYSSLCKHAQQPVLVSATVRAQALKCEEATNPSPSLSPLQPSQSHWMPEVVVERYRLASCSNSNWGPSTSHPGCTDGLWLSPPLTISSSTDLIVLMPPAFSESGVSPQAPPCPVP